MTPKRKHQHQPHQRKYITSYQPTLKTFQTIWIPHIQLSHNQSVLVQEELLSTLKLKRIKVQLVPVIMLQEQISNQLLDQLLLTKSVHQFIELLWKEEMPPQIEEMFLVDIQLHSTQMLQLHQVHYYDQLLKDRKSVV